MNTKEMKSPSVPPAHSPSIGVAIIARNAGASIYDCIKSFEEYVDQIVVVLAGKSKDDTAFQAKKASKKVEIYKFDWVKDFSAARNFSFSKITTDFVLWVDSDDVIENAKDIRGLIDNLPAQIGAIWLPYFYSFDDAGNCTTLFDRERILRTACGWIWRGRVHETAAPLHQMEQARADDVAIFHKHMHYGGSRSDRNFELLDLMHKEDPTDKRVWMYLGFQNFASSQWIKAAEWFTKFAQETDVVPIDKYQCLTYAARALREGRNHKDAINLDLMAMELYPEWADSYIGLCHSYTALELWDKAINWGELGRTKSPPTKVIFVNPLDYVFNVNLSLSLSYAHIHKFDKALEIIEAALQVRPDDESAKEQKKKLLEIKLRKEALSSVESLYFALGQAGEWEKASKLRLILPEWLKNTPDSITLDNRIKAKYEQVKKIKKCKVTKSQQSWVKEETEKYGEGLFVTDLEITEDPQERLKKAEKHSDLIMIAVGGSSPLDKLRHFEEQTVEELLIGSPDREILTIHEQDGVVATYRKGSPKEKIARIYSGVGFEAWNPYTIAERGCGGSETAAAMWARGLQQNGFQSVLYGAVDGMYDGVRYRKADKYQPNACDMFISSRMPELFDSPPESHKKILWFHDVHRGDRFTPERAEQMDYIVALSKWHAWYLQETYPFLKGCEVIDKGSPAVFVDDGCQVTPFYKDAEILYKPRIAIIGNGINTELFKPMVVKEKHRFIWSSSPDRGLLELLQHWPKIRKELKKATLHIFYGWEYFDSTLFIPQQRELKEKIIKLLEQPGVTWEGRVGQSQLAEEFAKSHFWYYPLHYSDWNKDPGGFRETFCITAVEAQAAGCLCVARSSGALGETVGDRGVLIPRDTKDELAYLFDLAYDEKRQDELRSRGKDWALNQGWDSITRKILEL